MRDWQKGLFVYFCQKKNLFYSRQCCWWWFQSVCAFTNGSRQDDELSEPNLFERIDKHKRRQEHSRDEDPPVVLCSDVTMSVHHWFSLHTRWGWLNNTPQTASTWLAHDVPSREGLTSKMTRQKLVWFLSRYMLNTNTDVRSLRLFRAFSFYYSVFFLKVFFLFLIRAGQWSAQNPTTGRLQISSDFQIGIFLLYPNRFARYCESESVISVAVCV